MNTEQVEKYRQGMWSAGNNGLKEVKRNPKGRISIISFFDFEKNINFYTDYSDILSVLFYMHALVFRDQFQAKVMLIKDHRRVMFKYSLYLGVPTKDRSIPVEYIHKFNLNEKFQLEYEEMESITTFKYKDFYGYYYKDDLEVLATEFTGGTSNQLLT